jgi:hypothetical protein
VFDYIAFWACVIIASIWSAHDNPRMTMWWVLGALIILGFNALVAVLKHYNKGRLPKDDD